MLKVFVSYADDDFIRPSLLLKKLSRSKSVKDVVVVDLLDFVRQSLPIVNDIKVPKQLEKRLYDVRKQGWERVARGFDFEPANAHAYHYDRDSGCCSLACLFSHPWHD